MGAREREKINELGAVIRLKPIGLEALVAETRMLVGDSFEPDREVTLPALASR